MAFDLGQFLQTMGHNFAQNANGGAAAGAMGGQPQPLDQKLLSVASILHGGAPGQAQPQTPGMGGMTPDMLARLRQAIGQIGGQPQQPGQPPAPSPSQVPMAPMAGDVAANLGAQSGLTPPGGQMSPIPNFASQFRRGFGFGGGY